MSEPRFRIERHPDGSIDRVQHRVAAVGQDAMCERCVRVGFGDGTSAIVCLGGRSYEIDGIPFDWHSFFGPCPLRKDGRGERRLGPYHRFWKVVSWWSQQGKRVAEDGFTCIYERCVERSVQLTGKHFAALNGDDPEAVRRKWFAKAGLECPSTPVNVIEREVV